MRSAVWAVAAVSCAVDAGAQCTTQWLPGAPAPGLYLGAQGAATTRALATYDPDGAGPLPEHLLATGTFDNIDVFACRYFADWDGARWSAPSAQLPSAGDAVAYFNGEYIVGGTFGVRRYDGTAWSVLGGASAGIVEALAVHNGELFAAGTFASLAGVPGTRGIARWDGTAWQSVGGGLDVQGGALALLSQSDGLVVAGGFAAAGGVASSDVARWTGTEWIAMPGIPASFVRGVGLARHAGETYLCGEPALIVDPSIFRWDGSTWVPLSSNTTGRVLGMASLGGDLIISGTFLNFAGVATPTRAARWNGAAWSALADTGGINVRTSSFGLGPLAVLNGDLIVGGESGYSWTPGDTVRWSLLKWNQAEAWRTFAAGFDGAVTDAILFGDDVVVTGGFRMAGGRRCNGVARFVEGSFEPMGQGVLAAASSSTTEFGADLEVWNDELYLAGALTALDGASVLGGVARWDGAAWRRTVSIPSNNPAAQMLDLCVHNGTLHLTGPGLVGGIGSNVWSYNGAAWSRVGDVGTLGPQTIESHAGVLYAGGSSGIRAWSGAGSWTLVPSTSYSGSTSTVVSLAEADGRLCALADGGFGSDFGVDVVGEFDNSLFRPVGSALVRGNVTSSIAGDIARYHGDVVAGRGFRLTSSTPNPFPALVRFNGLEWSVLAGDTTGLPPGVGGGATAIRVNCVVEIADTLWVGGVFANAGGQVSPYLARYQSSTGPSISQQPAPVSARVGGNASFSVIASNSQDALLRWRRNGVQLIEGSPLPGGTIAAGVNSANLLLQNVQVADGGTYDCMIANACGSARSAGAALSVTCPADLDSDGDAVNGLTPDGAVEIGDLLAFVVLFEMGDSAADLDDGSGTGISDGGVGISDLLYYLARFEAGC